MADDGESERIADLARLVTHDPESLTDDELVRLISTWGALRRSAPERLGRAIAILYSRDRLSWPEIGRRTGVPAMTAHDWARRYLPAGEDEGR
jgi:Homeodomain-like domain-containing protein